LDNRRPGIWGQSPQLPEAMSVWGLKKEVEEKKLKKKPLKKICNFKVKL